MLDNDSVGKRKCGVEDEVVGFFLAVFTILETQEKLLYLMINMWMCTGAASYGQAARVHAVRNKFEEKLRTPHQNITPPPCHATIPLHSDPIPTFISTSCTDKKLGKPFGPQCLVKEQQSRLQLAVCKGLLGWLGWQ